jgi:hypothetical protein
MVRPYDIPFGTLIPIGLSNLLVAGRCHSADAAALASSRVTVTCMVMGQAAGTAAAIAAGQRRTTRQLSVRAVQDALLADHALILESADRLREEGDRIPRGEADSTPNLDLNR